jgi:DNA polymerase-3 subunit chi
LTNTPIRVDFYVLATADPAARLRFACRLTEKAYTLDKRTYAHVDGPARARELDELLWTFRAGSFIPHQVEPGDPGADTPVTIGHAPETDATADLLINLADSIPSFFDRFGRIAEIIDASEEGRQAGRARFAFYRDNGYEPNTHKIA